LNKNNISIIPNEIGNLTNLEKIELYDNKIEFIPSEIGNLTNLQELHLSYNKIKSNSSMFEKPLSAETNGIL
jgi:Leucine-rich repeat (LRR) protein